MHEVVVLLPGFVTDLPSGRQRTGCTITLVRGRPNILVDTGDITQRSELLAALARQGVTPEEIGFVVNTHGHLDHIGNNALFPDATFLLDNDLCRYGEYWIHDFGVAPLHIDAEDGAAPVIVMRTPGHTDHDLTVVVETVMGRTAVAGDLFEYAGDGLDGAWRQWSKNPAQQQASRDLVLALADWIVPGHGDLFHAAR